MSVFIVTGPMAAGKSTVAELLAGKFPKAAHVRGDVFRRFVVAGREEMWPDPTPGAEDQLALRYRLAAHAADAYADAGFTAVVQDNILGPWLSKFVATVKGRPLYVVVLDPSVEAIEAREEAREKSGYKGSSVEEFVADFRASTPRIGLWLDTSEMTAGHTVDQILERLDEAAVG